MLTKTLVLVIATVLSLPFEIGVQSSGRRILHTLVTQIIGSDTATTLVTVILVVYVGFRYL